MTDLEKVRAWATATVALALAILTTRAACAQEQPQPQPSSVQLSGSLSQSVYTDSASENCEEQNANNPFAGMNPLVCKGEMMPTAGPGVCNFPGMQLIKQEGNTCFYCYPLNPPIVGIILPIDLAGLAEQQGFRCGADQADACMLICTGTGTFRPPPGVRLVSGPPGNPGPRPPSSPPAAPPIAPGQPSGTSPERTQQPGPQTCTPTRPLTNPAIDCLAGVVAGIGDCVQGNVNAIAGAGYFFMGDFVNAAKMWGLQPGQSAVLGTIWKELTTPTIGANVTTFQRCQTQARRICAYVAVPAIAKAAGGALKGAGKGQTGTAAGAGGNGPGETGSAGGGGPGEGSVTKTAPGGNESVTQPSSGAKPGNYVITGGTSAGNAIGGLDLLGDVTANPAGLANKWVKLPSGPVQLGGFAGVGSFAAVYRTTGGNIVKITKETPGAATSLQGQIDGAKILNDIGVPTPNIIDYQPPGFQQAGALTVADLAEQFPGAQQLSSKGIPNMGQSAIAGQLEQFANKLGGSGNVMLDTNLNNLAISPTDGVVVIDPDMIVPASQLPAYLEGNPVAAGVLADAQESVGATCQTPQAPVNAQAFMNTVWLPAVMKRLQAASSGQ
jgi:hypothetical protein